MKLLVQLFGIDLVETRLKELKSEHPNMHEDWYIRQVIRSNIKN
jgi:hypothetical protein